MNGLLFLLPFILVASVGVYQDSFAENEIRGYDYSTVRNWDGSFTRTLGLSPFIYDNSTNSYQPFIASGNQIETEHGSVKLTTSGFQYFPNGKIVDSTPRFTDSIVAKYADISDLNTWTYPNALNNKTPTLARDGSTLTSTKAQAGLGILEYKYILDNGKWKTQLEATNLSSLTTKAFGFDQIIELNSDTIRFGGVVRNLDNFNGTTFSKSFLDNNKGKVLDLMNGYYFDFDIAYDDLYSVTVHDTGVGKSRLVFDFRTDSILMPNETLILDPTFGYIVGTDYDVYTGSGTGTSCPSPTTKYIPTYANGRLNLAASGIAESCEILVPTFNVSSIPSESVITDVDIRYDVNAVSSPLNCNFTPVTVTVSTATASAIWTDVSGATPFVSNDSGCTTATTDKTLDLGTSADTSLQNNLADGEFSVGVTFNTFTRDGTLRRVNLGNFELTVTYNLPPNPPKLTNGTVTPSTGVDLYWSAPAQNGGTGTINYNVTRSADGSTFTDLATTTSTTYEDSVPLEQDYGYYRVYSSDSLGQGSGYSFPLNQTSSVDVVLSVPYDYTLVDQKNATNTITTTGNQLYVPGHNGGARYFDGASYDLTTSKTPYNFDVATPFTITGWINYPTIGSTGMIAGHTSGYTSTAGYGFTKDSSEHLDFRFRTSTPQNNAITSGTALSANTPYFVAVVYDGTSNRNGLHLYLNGVLDTDGTAQATTGSFANSQVFSIGAESDGGVPFTGWIDDVRIFNDNLDANEISQLYYERLDTSDLAIPPNGVSDLTAEATDLTSAVLDWSAPEVFGTITGYMINYTTPQGDPTTIVTADTGNTLTEAEVVGLDGGADYSFRVSPVTIYGTNDNGNIANATAFQNFEIGGIAFPTGENPDELFEITFDNYEHNSTATDVQVVYDSSMDLTCDFVFVNGQTNQTYSGLTENVISGTDVYSNFTLQNPNNEIIDIYCYDSLDELNNARHRLTNTVYSDIPIINQILGFQSGDYGTTGMFGAIDLITLLIIIISIIGFNRVNPAVGIILMFMMLGIMAWFELIEIPTTIIGIIILIITLGIASVKKA